MSIEAVHCRLDNSSQQNSNQQSGNLQTESVTVGTHMLLSCDGELGGVLSPGAQIHFAKQEDEFKLVVLNVKNSTEKSIQLVVTSYLTGEHKDVIAEITDGKIHFQTSPLSWTVTSVLKPDSKPIPSYGPFELAYPLWFWLSWAAMMTLVLGTAFFYYYRRHRRKKLLEELEKYNTMLTPFGQFSKDARFNLRALTQIRSDEEARKSVQKIDEDFRLYLVRELKVPALQFKMRELINEIKKYHRPIYDESISDLRRVLFELDKAKKLDEKVKAKDCEDLLFLTRAMADKIYAVRRRVR